MMEVDVNTSAEVVVDDSLVRKEASVCVHQAEHGSSPSPSCASDTSQSSGGSADSSGMFEPMTETEQLLTSMWLKKDELHFLNNNSVDLSEDMNVILHNAKDMFGKLRAEYIHLETQHGILEGLINDNVMEALASGLNREVEAEVKREKAKIREWKTEIATVKSQIITLLHSNAREWREFLAAKHSFEEHTYDKENDMKNHQDFLARLAQDRGVYGDVDDDALRLQSTDQCSAVIHSQREQLERLSVEGLELEQRASAANHQLAELSQSIVNLRGRVQAMEGSDSAQTTTAFLNKQAEWYESMKSMLESMSDVQMTAEGGALKLTMPGDYVLCWDAYAKQSPLTTNITLEGGEWQIPLKDIVAQFSRSNDLNFLVREVRSRTQFFASRQNALVDLISTFNMIASTEQPTVEFTASNGVAVTVFVPFNYGAPLTRPAVLSVSLSDAHSHTPQTLNLLPETHSLKEYFQQLSDSVAPQ